MPAITDPPPDVEPGQPDETTRYDQIAWFTGQQGSPEIALEHARAGRFDFPELVLGDLNRRDLSWRISDHYPLWAEFSLSEGEPGDSRALARCRDTPVPGAAPAAWAPADSGLMAPG